MKEGISKALDWAGRHIAPEISKDGENHRVLSKFYAAASVDPDLSEEASQKLREEAQWHSVKPNENRKETFGYATAIAGGVILVGIGLHMANH